jgi:hypothetical protein
MQVKKSNDLDGEGRGERGEERGGMKRNEEE